MLSVGEGLLYMLPTKLTEGERERERERGREGGREGEGEVVIQYVPHQQPNAAGLSLRTR